MMFNLIKYKKISSILKIRSYNEIISSNTISYHFSSISTYNNNEKELKLTSREPNPGDLVYVAMSGGVDSSVTAYLMKQKGYKVKGIYMRNWDANHEDNEDISNRIVRCDKDWRKVESIATHFNIPCQRLDLVKPYWTEVFDPTLKEYQAGMTPNPDMTCNQVIKFDYLINQLKKLSSDQPFWLATGHYARLCYNPSSNLPVLQQAIDPIKDQTYYLASVAISNFNRVLFPLGGYTKPAVKQLARSIGLTSIADQPESMGICFVGKRTNFSTFLSQYLVDRPGNIITSNGTKIGEHRGLWQYTLGQRVRLSYKSVKWYVGAKNIEKNLMIVVDNRDHPMLHHSEIELNSIKWSYSYQTFKDLSEGKGKMILIKARSTQPPTSAYIKQVGPLLDNRYKLIFTHPIRGLAPGQFIVLYDLDSTCLGYSKLDIEIT